MSYTVPVNDDATGVDEAIARQRTSYVPVNDDATGVDEAVARQRTAYTVPVNDDATGVDDAVAKQSAAANTPSNQGPTDQTVNLSGIKSNALNKYSSYNNLFTLACLSVQQQNTGVFSSANLNNIVASSKGDWNNQGSRRTTTDFGNFDFFIDDVIITSLPSLNSDTGNSFAMKITFQVTEPYSMGLFLLTLQDGAERGKYLNYRDAAYLMVIEWAGYDDNNVPSIDPQLTRYIPIKFIDIKMKVTRGGTIYECEAIPYNEVALRDPITQVQTSIQISGSNVDEFLVNGEKSLLRALRDFRARQVRDKILPSTDEYEITFPKDFTDPGNSGNDISKSVLYTDLTDSGTVPFPGQAQVFDSVKRIYQNSKVRVSEKKNFNFPMGTKIEDIITDVVIRSDYIAKQLTNERIVSNPNGMINWFRIETRVEDKEEFNPAFGRQNRKYIYRVVPYQVHINRFLRPNAKPTGYQNLNSTVHRRYDYIYTGRNTEILNVNLDFNMAYFAPLPSDGTKNVGTSAANFGSNAQINLPANAIRAGNSPAIQQQTGPGASSQTVYQPPSQVSSATDQGRTQGVKHLQSILQNPGDLVNLELEIMGDPYYIPSSGMGNQIKKPIDTNILSDGSLNYQSGEVDILIKFRTPIDLDPDTGLYKFSRVVDQFSGLFMVLEIESKFNKNKFTQIIKCVRRRTQLGASAPADTAQETIVFRIQE